MKKTEVMELTALNRVCASTASVTAAEMSPREKILRSEEAKSRTKIPMRGLKSSRPT